MKKGILTLIMALVVAVQPVTTSGEPEQDVEPDRMEETTVEVQGQVEISSVNGINIFKLPEETDIPEEYQNYCIEIGKQYHICPELLMAMIEQESSGRADVVNETGDTGLLQVNPKWHKERMERLGVSDLTDPYSNILVAADYLEELFQESDGDIYLVLMKYNMKHGRAVSLVTEGLKSIKWINRFPTKLVCYVVAITLTTPMMLALALMHKARYMHRP